MTTTKSEKGFSFRELTFFNSTLLANMEARLMSEPNALWVHVIKFVYFPTTYFLQAAKGGRVSWGWLSLLVGGDVLRQGVWSLRNGKSIQLFIYKWVTTVESFRVR